jgi:UTP--glucose-1-phosphate uridylyltransferase
MCLFAKNMDVVRDAVLVAAGLGTRMFPSSAYQAKETLPLVDVPLLTHLIMEAKAAGITRFHVVTSPVKSFESMLEDKQHLHALRSDLERSLFHITEGLEVHTHLQLEPKGVGNAIEAALGAIDGPFLVMLGDNLMMDVHAPTTAYAPSMASKHLVDAFAAHGEATVGLMEVAEHEVSHYGIVALNGSKITDVVEKPSTEDAPSRLAMCGRYVFPATTSKLLEMHTYERHGELQSIALQQHWMSEGTLHGVVFEDTQWYDSGSPILWLQAQVDHALRRSDLHSEFRAWLEQRLQD